MNPLEGNNPWLRPLVLAALLLLAPIRLFAQSLTESITVNATLNGAPWSGKVNYEVLGPTAIVGSFVPQTYTNPPLGTYTLTYLNGGPSGAILSGISPADTQTLTAGTQIVFTLNFFSGSAAPGSVQVDATLDGNPWAGSVSYQIQGPDSFSGTSVPQSYSNRPPGAYTLHYLSGGPPGASLTEISPAATQTLLAGSTIGFTLVFSSGPPEPGALSVEPRQLHVYVSAGSGPVQRALRIVSSRGTIEWTARVAETTGPQWLTLSPTSGTATAAQPSMMVASLDPTGLDNGVHQSNLIVRNSASGEEVTVPVALVVRASESRLRLSRSTFLFTTASGGTPPAQVLRISNAGSGSLQWSIPADALNSALWLRVSATAGTADSLVTLSVNSAGLSDGVHQVLLPVVAPGGADSPQLVTITFYIAPILTPPRGEMDPFGLVFLAQQGQAAPSPQTVVVQNVGAGSVDFQWLVTTNSGGNWLSISPANGSLNGPTSVSAQVSVNPAFLPPDIYKGSLVAAYSTGAAQTIEVVLVVTPTGVSLQRNEAVAPACVPTSLELVATTIGNGVELAVSFPRPVVALVVNNCGGSVDDATVVANIEGLSLVLTGVGGGAYSGTWTPQTESSTVAVSVAAMHPTLGSVQHDYTVSTSAAEGEVLPLLAPNGVVEGAGFTPQWPLAPGAIVSLFGTTFASGQSLAGNIPLERSLGGTSVRIGGEDAPLYYVGPGQINAQVPFTAQVGETVSIVVNANGKLTAPQSYLIAPAEPGIFHGAVLDYQNDPEHGGLAVTAAHPAHRGDDLIIYSNGLGLVDQDVGTGEASPGAQVLVPVTVKIGGVEVPVAYAGLTPGYVGLYQVNVKLTDGVPTGDGVAVELEQNGISSNPILPITISIH